VAEVNDDMLTLIVFWVLLLVALIVGVIAYG
jgi:hypothetical protein